MNQSIQGIPFGISVAYLIFWSIVRFSIHSESLWSFSQAIYIYILFILPISIFVFFVPQKIFSFLLKFVIPWTLFFLFTIIFIIPDTSQYTFYLFDRYVATLYFFGPILVLGSLITISISWWRSRKP